MNIVRKLLSIMLCLLLNKRMIDVSSDIFDGRDWVLCHGFINSMKKKLSLISRSTYTVNFLSNLFMTLLSNFDLYHTFLLIQADI